MEKELREIITNYMEEFSYVYVDFEQFGVDEVHKGVKEYTDIIISDILAIFKQNLS